MSDSAVFPPHQIVMPPLPAKVYSKTVTTTAAQIDSTGVECVGVMLQSSELNDSNGAVTANMYVQVGGVLGWELKQGESVFIPCANTNEIYVKTQAGTAWVRAIVYKARTS